MERSGRIVSVDADCVTVRFERESACASCRSAKVCAGNAPSQTIVLPQPSGSRLDPGDLVRVGVAEEALLRATVMTYLTPLAGLGVVMACAAAAGLPDGVVALASFAGLGLGFALVRRLARRAPYQLRPALVDEHGSDS